MKHIKNEEAVSPVIGVILMVVITVIIAAILAVFSFGIGGPTKAPEVNLKYIGVANSTGGNLSLTHEGGDALILKDEKITVNFASNGTTALSSSQPMPLDSAGGFQYINGKDTLAAGQKITGPLVAGIKVGEILEVIIVDTPTGQLISKARVVVQ